MFLFVTSYIQCHSHINQKKEKELKHTVFCPERKLLVDGEHSCNVEEKDENRYLYRQSDIQIYELQNLQMSTNEER